MDEIIMIYSIIYLLKGWETNFRFWLKPLKKCRTNYGTKTIEPGLEIRRADDTS